MHLIATVINKAQWFTKRCKWSGLCHLSVFESCVYLLFLPSLLTSLFKHFATINAVFKVTQSKMKEVKSGNSNGLRGTREIWVDIELHCQCCKAIFDRCSRNTVMGVKIHWYWIFMRTFRAVQLLCLFFSVAQLHWE